MKKPYSEEKTGLKTELKKLKILLLIFFLQAEVLSQIPINGFCKYSLLKTEPGYTNFFSLNFNNDSYTDLLLFNPLKKEIVPLEGNFNGTFITKKIIKTSLEINEIITLTDKSNNVTGYAFTSRRGMKAGTFNVSGEGKPILLNEIKFNFYPENISAADIDGTGVKQMLVSGSGFDGLSILYAKENSLKENKILGGTNFSEAVFSDLNSDGFSDIAAFDFISSNINFYYNNRRGEFRKVRSIETEKKIYSLRSLDINMDDYDDLIFVENEGIRILFGDYISSFSNKVFIKTLFRPDKFISGDFNRDGMIDIVYINLTESIVSVIYSKENFEFYPEIIYMQKEGIQNLIPYYSKFISGFAVISSTGDIHTITKLSSFSYDVNISAGVKPSAINYFDIDNNGINNICFIDDYDNSFKIIRRNSSGLPSQLYNYSLYENHSEILINNTANFIKIFIFYSADKKLIEIFRINFDKNTHEKFSLYVRGNLKDVKALNMNGREYIYAAYVDEGTPGCSIFTYSEGKYLTENHIKFDELSDITDLSLNKNISLYLWRNNNESLSINRIFLKGNNNRRIFSRNYADNISLVISSGDILNEDNEAAAGFISSPKIKSLVISTDSMVSVINNNKILTLIDIKTNDQVFIGEVRFNGINRMNVYNPESKILYRLDLIKNGREISAAKLGENLDIKKYFIKNMNFKSYHIVYTNRKLDCISIKKI